MLQLIMHLGKVRYKLICKNQFFSYITAINKWNLKLKTQSHQHLKNEIFRYKSNKICPPFIGEKLQDSNERNQKTK